MRRRVSCPVLVGRSVELARLRTAMACAEAGEPGALFLAGEAGIGKTRLIDEFAAAISPRTHVLRGGCVPLAEGLLAYIPIVELLRGLGERIGRPALRDLAGADRDVLARLVPELADHATAPPPGIDTDLDRGRLFAALRGVLERLAAR